MLDRSEVRRRIEQEYARRGDPLGWRLLYSPWRTVEGADVAFIGLNPGVGPHSDEHSDLSVEEGSAYEVETWAQEPGGSVLQRQVIALFELLGVEPSKVLAGNLIPFRSRNLAELADRGRATTFGMSLWREILNSACPRLVITMGRPATNALREIGNIGELRTQRLGWGAVKGFVGEGKYRLVGLPHLSRFTVVNRQASRPGLQLLFLDDLK